MAGRRRMRPEYYHGLMALVLTLTGAGGLLLLFRPARTGEVLLAAWLVSVSVVTFAYYGHDKGRARNAGNRVPEVVLHGLALAGGSIGAYAGMRLFRHKTVKGTFRIVFWVIAVLQVLLIVAVIYRLVTS